MLNQKILDDVKNLGISAAAYFTAGEGDFKFDARFRKLCEDNTCGSYGRNYMCPPAIGSFEDCKNEILRFKHALVAETIYPLEDSFDFEGMMEGQAKHNKMARSIARLVYEGLGKDKALVLSAGGCSFCEVCGIITGEPCRAPENAMASLEAYGINVSEIGRVSDLKYINGVNTVTYFAGVFY